MGSVGAVTQKRLDISRYFYKKKCISYVLSIKCNLLHYLLIYLPRTCVTLQHQ